MVAKLLRRLRGLFGVGATWGTLWGVIGAGIGFVLGLVNPSLWTFENPVAVWGLGMAAYGFVSGLGFGTLLSLVEGRKVLRELSLKRVALLGLLGSAAVPLVFVGFFDAGTTLADIVGAMAVTGILGGTFAPGAVAVARRAELTASKDPRLLGEARLLEEDAR